MSLEIQQGIICVKSDCNAVHCLDFIMHSLIRLIIQSSDCGKALAVTASVTHNGLFVSLFLPLLVKSSHSRLKAAGDVSI